MGVEIDLRSLSDGDQSGFATITRNPKLEVPPIEVLFSSQKRKSGDFFGKQQGAFRNSPGNSPNKSVHKKRTFAASLQLATNIFMVF